MSLSRTFAIPLSTCDFAALFSRPSHPRLQTCRISIFRYDGTHCHNGKEKFSMVVKYRLKSIAKVSLIALLVAKGSVLWAADIQDQAQIRAAIETAVSLRTSPIPDTSIEVEIGAIDSRLRLASCDNIQIMLPPSNAAAMTAKVTCDAPSWTLYVPIRLHAWVQAVVAATNLAPNTKLTAASLTRGRADAFAGNGGLITNPRDAEGKILRAGLMAGAAILTPQLDLPIAVRRGQKVMLTLYDAAMTIKTTATALEDGRVGDSISIENPDSRKSLHATVARDGGVEIRF